MIIKLDIRKAYDEVNISFLLKVLDRFGFCREWISWIDSCISNIRFPVLVNGSPQGLFESIKGFRQGDPIFPFLFIILAEVLGRLITKSRSDGKWKGIKIVNGLDTLNHLYFADDTYLVREASIWEARNTKLLLDRYSKASGQCVNCHKSENYFFNTNLLLQEN